MSGATIDFHWAPPTRKTYSNKNAIVHIQRTNRIPKWRARLGKIQKTVRAKWFCENQHQNTGDGVSFTSPILCRVNAGKYEQEQDFSKLNYRNYSNLTRPLINAHRPFLAKIVIHFRLILFAYPKFLVIYFPLIINAQPNLQ